MAKLGLETVTPFDLQLLIKSNRQNIRKAKSIEMSKQKKSVEVQIITVKYKNEKRL